MSMIEKYWPGLPGDICKEVNQVAINRSFKKGEFLFVEGDRPQGLYVISMGLVGLMRGSCDGTEQILRVFRSGDFFGHRSVITGETCHGSAMAIEDTELMFVPAEKLQDLFDRYPGFVMSMCRYLSYELKEAEKKLTSLTSARVEKRVAQTVLYLKSRYPEHQWTRREMADFCGTTTATVIRILGRFEKMGLISQEGRKINFVKLDELKALAFTDNC